MMAHSAQERVIPTELVARLEAASVGSRELDCDLDIALFGGDALPHHPDRVGRRDGNGYGFTQAFATYTTSLDAALALAERVLGDEWAIYVSRLAHWNGGPVWRAHVTDGCVTREDWLAPTPALALCAAILKATTAPTPTPVGTEPMQSAQCTQKGASDE